jgi:hypothetical protein
VPLTCNQRTTATDTAYCCHYTVTHSYVSATHRPAVLSAVAGRGGRNRGGGGSSIAPSANLHPAPILLSRKTGLPIGVLGQRRQVRSSIIYHTASMSSGLCSTATVAIAFVLVSVAGSDGGFVQVLAASAMVMFISARRVLSDITLACSTAADHYPYYCTHLCCTHTANTAARRQRASRRRTAARAA